MQELVSERLSFEQALDLLKGADTAELMARADCVRHKKQGRDVFHVHSLNLNPTNVCENQCGLCAFWSKEDSERAYTLSLTEIEERLERSRGWRLTDVHVVGGLNRELGLDYYLELLRLIKGNLPTVAVQALTAVEIHWLAERAGKPLEEVLTALKTAGMDAIPGGGAEIFSDRVRERICTKKISAEQWLNVHRVAHSLGIPSNATMLFGHIETDEEIIDHLSRLRDLQDETGGFQAFCPLPFHAVGTQIGVPPSVSNRIAFTPASSSGYRLSKHRHLSRRRSPAGPYVNVKGFEEPAEANAEEIPAYAGRPGFFPHVDSGACHGQHRFLCSDGFRRETGGPDHPSSGHV